MHTGNRRPSHPWPSPCPWLHFQASPHPEAPDCLRLSPCPSHSGPSIWWLWLVFPAVKWGYEWSLPRKAVVMLTWVSAYVALTSSVRACPSSTLSPPSVGSYRVVSSTVLVSWHGTMKLLALDLPCHPEGGEGWHLGSCWGHHCSWAERGSGGSNMGRAQLSSSTRNFWTHYFVIRENAIAFWPNYVHSYSVSPISKVAVSKEPCQDVLYGTQEQTSL